MKMKIYEEEYMKVQNNILDRYMDRSDKKFQNDKFSSVNSLCYTEFLRYYYVSTISNKDDWQPVELTDDMLETNIVCRKFEPHLLQTTPPIWPSLPLFIFFPNLPLLARLFRQCRTNEILDKHKNKLMWQRCFFIFRRLKTTLHAFLQKILL